MPPNVKEIHNLLRRLPVEDQLAMVLITIVQANSDSLNVSLRMLGATIKLSEHLLPPTGSKFRRHYATRLTCSKSRW